MYLEDQDQEPIVYDLKQNAEPPCVKGVDGRLGRRGLQLLDMAPGILLYSSERSDNALCVRSLDLLEVFALSVYSIVYRVIRPRRPP